MADRIFQVGERVGIKNEYIHIYPRIRGEIVKAFVYHYGPRYDTVEYRVMLCNGAVFNSTISGYMLFSIDEHLYSDFLDKIKDRM